MRVRTLIEDVMRVLLAEDDAALRYGLQVQLERWGYTPVVCANGDDAAAVIRGDDPPALMILDWSMPGVDGVVLCREIRATPPLSGAYVVLLTANDFSA